MGKFELFKKRAARPSKGPAATVQTRGAFTLNTAALAQLENPEAVHLFFDAEDKRVGIEKADPSSAYAYPTRPNGKGLSHLISAKTFMDVNGISYEKTVSVPLSFEGRMAVLQVDFLVGKRNEGE